MIEISAEAIGNYSYQLNGSSATNFTNNALIENLDAGNYNLLITDNSTQDTFSFDIVISEPENLKANTKVLESSKQITLTLSGSNEYTIKLNGNTFTTTENELILPLEDGINSIEVQGEKECQGKFDQKISIGNTISVYPNPVNDYLNIISNTEDDTTIKIFDISGKLIKSKSSNSSRGIHRIYMQDLNAGIYFVRVNTTSSSSTFKISK